MWTRRRIPSGRLVLCLAAAGCGASSARTPIIQIRDGARPNERVRRVVLPFSDRQNGTELLLKALAGARAARALAVSGVELRVGRCVRRIGLSSKRPDNRSTDAPPDRDLDRITYSVRETRYTCRRSLEQMVTPGGGDAPRAPASRKARGMSSENQRFQLGDAEMVEIDRCEQRPIGHIVTRYRFELEHEFATPDWQVIEAWSGLPLTSAGVSCDSGPARGSLAMTLHFDGGPPATRRPPPERTPDRAMTRAGRLVRYARSADAAARRGRPDEAARWAARAITEWSDGDVVELLPEDAARRTLYWVSAARFYRLEPQAAALLERRVPVVVDAAWAADLGAEIDRLAAGYMAIADLVRVDAVAPWVRAGAARLSRIHRRVAGLLERANQPAAARIERKKAEELEAIAHPGPVIESP